MLARTPNPTIGLKSVKLLMLLHILSLGQGLWSQNKESGPGNLHLNLTGSYSPAFFLKYSLGQTHALRLPQARNSFQISTEVGPQPSSQYIETYESYKASVLLLRRDIMTSVNLIKKKAFNLSLLTVLEV